MGEEAVAKNWRAMIKVGHDFYHCWRQVLLEELGPGKTEDLTLRFWEKVADVTAKAYAKAKVLEKGGLEGLVRAMVRSSEIMGETVHLERDGEDFLLVHDACPWADSHREYGGGNCQPGCDRWFMETVRILMPDCTVVTESSIPGGQGKCVRRFSIRRDQG